MVMNFADIATRKVEEIERPPLPPVGTYRWLVTKLPEQSKVGKDDQYDVVTFYVKAVEALDNVDMESYKGEVNGILLRKAFLFDTLDEAKFEQTLFNLRTFLEKHLRCAEAGTTINEALNAAVNGEFLGDVRWTQDKRDESGETFQAEIGRTAPVE